MKPAILTEDACKLMLDVSGKQFTSRSPVRALQIPGPFDLNDAKHDKGDWIIEDGAAIVVKGDADFKKQYRPFRERKKPVEK